MALVSGISSGKHKPSNNKAGLEAREKVARAQNAQVKRQKKNGSSAPVVTALVLALSSNFINSALREYFKGTLEY
ncbi:hypothetical protein BCU79_12340 [Vibrio breoganii]|nr:hypothetical protein BCU79_12340 [Vibrio breoganii]PMI16074.1 hypothetical protein BCU49_01880 [Vibrio breoganii]PMJ46087.1 hypothetical protein BCU21_11920 [Vibrio breoganii]PMK55027.1 hypothetical protein BCT97_00610 [Vibrio breoganii]PMM19837.1 hypothetical protein BCT59_08575 [Vibrio breoganii]